jgi:hypothetical protein
VLDPGHATTRSVTARWASRARRGSSAALGVLGGLPDFGESSLRAVYAETTSGSSS